MLQNGTTTAHNKTWPTVERIVYEVSVVGHIEQDGQFSAERLQAQLDELLSPYGLQARVGEVMLVDMHPEDRAEKEALDEAAVA